MSTVTESRAGSPTDARLERVRMASFGAANLVIIGRRRG
jgi:hypothetical protein